MATSTDTAPEVKCTVNGHDHMLKVRKRLVQDGTGAIAWSLECPTGRYRFTLLPAGSMVRYTRPRFGWSD